MRLRTCCAAMLILSAVQSAVADPPILVKEHGDLSQLIVEGNETFTADQIRDALDRNLELLARRRRLAPYSEFEEALARLVRDGYLYAGFAHVVVDLTFDDERNATVVTIREGARYKCGEVSVSGVPDDIAALIRRRLTEPYLAVDDVVVGVHDEETGDLSYGFNAAGEPVELTEPVWESGKPADFHHTPDRRFLEPATKALRDAGFEGAVIAVDLIRSADQEVASLHVDVIDAGRPIVIDEIVVDGVERHTPEAVIEFLGLVAPLDWTPQLRRRLNQELWECGRFQTFSVSLDAPTEEAMPTRLRIELLEYDAVPLLTEELSEVDQILCRAAHWFTTEAGRTNDVFVSGHDPRDNREAGPESVLNISRLHAVASARRGCIVDLDWRSPGDREGRSFTIAVEEDRLFALSGLTGRRFEYWLEDPSRLKLWFAYLGAEVLDADYRTRFRFGAGVAGESSAGVQLDLAASPMAMLYTARRDNPECTIADGILTIRSPHFLGEFEAATGRWIQFAFLDPEIEASFATIRFEKDAFEPAMMRHEERARRRPLEGSIPAFVAGELIALISETGGAHAESLIVLTSFSADLSRRLGDRVSGTGGGAPRPQRFHIPWSPERPPEISRDVAGILQAGNRFLFPRDSTFARFGRELLLAWVLRDEEAAGNLERLLNGYSTGPLVHWYAAEVFRFVNPVLAQNVGRQGLDRLNRRRFVDDCRQLLTREDIVNDVIEDCVAALRQMDDPQLTALFAPIASLEQRASMIAALRRDDSSDLDVLLTLLGELWDAKLQDLLRQRLIDLGGGPEIRNAGRRHECDPVVRATALTP